MADIPTTPAMAPAGALEAAQRWFIALREREMAARGQPLPPGVLAQHLTLALADGQPAQHGTPMRLGLQSRFSDCTVRLNARDGALVSWYIDALAQGGHDLWPAPDALALATAVAQPPAQAVLSEHGYETMADRCFYRARWTHVEAGLPVEGDYIEVLVNGKFRKAFSLARRWREVRLGQAPQAR